MRMVLSVVFLSLPLFSQQYPRWFLEQRQIPCGAHIVSVMRAPTLYKDSAVALAFRTGCELKAKYTALTIRGGQTFWTTEAGVHSMGANYTESFDAEAGEGLQSRYAVLRSFVDDRKTLVLAGDSSSCRLDDSHGEIVDISRIMQPVWVEQLPDDGQYHYGVGTSEEYYYEASSWQRAEQNAVMALARTVRSKVVSLQKKSAMESQDLFNEEIDVLLQEVQVLARWRDVKSKIFYVFVRCTK